MEYESLIDGLFIYSFLHLFVVSFSNKSKTYYILSRYEQNVWNNLWTCALFQIMFVFNCISNMITHIQGGSALEQSNRNFDYLVAFFIVDSFSIMLSLPFTENIMYVVHHICGVILVYLCKGCTMRELLFTNFAMMCGEIQSPALNLRKIVMLTHGPYSREYVAMKSIARHMFVTFRLRLFLVVLSLYALVIYRVYESFAATCGFMVLGYGLYGASYKWYNAEMAKNLL